MPTTTPTIPLAAAAAVSARRDAVGVRPSGRPRLDPHLAGAVAHRLDACPAVRAGAVAGARARLAAGDAPTPLQVADALLLGVAADRLA